MRRSAIVWQFGPCCLLDRLNLIRATKTSNPKKVKYQRRRQHGSTAHGRRNGTTSRRGYAIQASIEQLISLSLSLSL